MNKKIWILLGVIVVIVGGYFLYANYSGMSMMNGTVSATATSSKIKIVYAVQWSESDQLNGFTEPNGTKVLGLNQYLAEYNAAHPDVDVVAETIPENDYATELPVLSSANEAPDIYQVYSIWAPAYVQSGILAQSPADIVQDVQTNYISSAGATIGGQIWGIPTEVDDYALLYNKNLFKAAGIVDANGNALAPTTWAELVADAVKLTTHDAKGNIAQYGMAFLTGNDWQSVDPFLSLLFSNGGQYLSADNSKALFNSVAGVGALSAEYELFQKGATDINGNFYNFGKGTVGMVIAPPWVKATFEQNFGNTFASTVGVAPLPYLKKSATLQYSWFMGVMAKSAHQEQAWDFLRWFTETVQPSGTTPLGDLLAENIGAIPDRKVDFNAHQDVLGDFFTSVFVAQMKNSIAEPNIIQAQSIKDDVLMKSIEAVWGGQQTPQQALSSAAMKTNALLATSTHL